jgi:hypothetical protein
MYSAYNEGQEQGEEDGCARRRCLCHSAMPGMKREKKHPAAQEAPKHPAD